MMYGIQRKTRGKLLEAQEWYVGLLTRTAVECYLKREGDFVVRTSETSGALEFVVSVRGATKCAHYTVFYEDDAGWGLNLDNKKTFPSVVDLVQYYQRHNLPGSGSLKNPVKRPKWYLKHEHLSYDINKDLLGSGNFCDVYKGRLNITKSVAIKICHGPNGEKKGEDLLNAEKAKESLIKEGSLMAGYRHPNIIKFYGICCDRPPLCVVMERCYGGSLLVHLEKYTNDISTGERVRYCLEAARGMSYLQDRNCIHRDLAARNCLISKFGVIKIADFGLSKVVTEIAGEKLENQQIPVRWMAPETLKRDPEYSLKSDVWAYGMLLFEIYNNGGKPWPDWEPKRIATHIRKGRMIDLPGGTPEPIKELVNECWRMDVSQRCDFKHIVKQLIAVQLKFPPPRPENSTIARIPRVTALSMQEMEVLQEQQDIDDEALDEPNSSSDDGRRQGDPEREATIEEVAVKRTPRKKKYKDGEKKRKDRRMKKIITAIISTRSEETDKSRPTSEDTEELRRAGVKRRVQEARASRFQISADRLNPISQRVIPMPSLCCNSP